MKIIETEFPGLKVVEMPVYPDDRGVFMEIFHKKKFKDKNINFIRNQDNISISKKNVLRGLHFQMKDVAQNKLVYVLNGKIQDVVVDLRRNSITFKKYYSIILDSEDIKKNNFIKMLYIPKGFAHGYLSLEDNTIFGYKCGEFYNNSQEETLLYNDITLNINWENKENIIVSEKDKKGKSLNEVLNIF